MAESHVFTKKCIARNVRYRSRIVAGAECMWNDHAYGHHKPDDPGYCACAVFMNTPTQSLPVDVYYLF